MGKIRILAQRFCRSYTQYIEKHGLGLIIAACIATVAGSAAWTYANIPAEPVAPVLPAEEVQSAADLMQESLADSIRPTSTPEVTEPVYCPPVDYQAVLTAFDATRLMQSPVTGMWSLHDAVDLSVSHGQQIVSIADGVVLSVEDDSLHGTCIIIDHGYGITAQYMGMKAHAGLRTDDPVSCGQTIGFGGVGMTDEIQEPHLHLRVTKNGAAVDPLVLWNGNDE